MNNGVIEIAAALLVLFCAIVNTRLSLVLALLALGVLALYRFSQNSGDNTGDIQKENVARSLPVQGFPIRGLTGNGAQEHNPVSKQWAGRPWPGKSEGMEERAPNIQRPPNYQEEVKKREEETEPVQTALLRAKSESSSARDDTIVPKPIT